MILMLSPESFQHGCLGRAAVSLFTNPVSSLRIRSDLIGQGANLISQVV
jgi:hypothetical protein